MSSCSLLNIIILSRKMQLWCKQKMESGGRKYRTKKIEPKEETKRENVNNVKEKEHRNRTDDK